MVHRELEAILKQAIGLKITSIGQATVDRVLGRRLSALNLETADDYVDRLKSSPQELKILIEEMVIPETWFFRDRDSYAALTRFLRDKLKPTGNRLLRILSIPCSTGEEPYSIVITVMEAGWPQHLFRIDAVDISSRSIELARQAEYRGNSFRGEDLQFRERYFEKEGAVFRLQYDIRRQVRFYQGNLLNWIFMESLGVYDVIFCRNVLIYLDTDAQARTIDHLERALMPDGLLFIGHSEAGLFTSGPFVHSPYHKAFVLTKRSPLPAPVTSPASKPPPRESLLNFSVPVRLPPAPKPSGQGNPPVAAGGLDHARRLADQGHLQEATMICEEHLRLHGPSADAFFLLGVMQDVQGDQETAVKLLRKAVYLKPDLHDALILLALIAERQGDEISAGNYRRRAQRLLDN